MVGSSNWTVRERQVVFDSDRTGDIPSLDMGSNPLPTTKKVLILTGLF